MILPDDHPIVGQPSEWRAFAQRNRTFLQGREALMDLMRRAFRAGVEPKNLPVDSPVNGMVQLCAEDFRAILILAGNGNGVAALKLLRPMYERALTAQYLSAHPEKAEAFPSKPEE